MEILLRVARLMSQLNVTQSIDVKMAILPGGRDAVTHYNVKERFRDFTRIQAQLETGRTHQIRVHFSYLGHGLIGDPVYVNRVRFQLAHRKS